MQAEPEACVVHVQRLACHRPTEQELVLLPGWSIGAAAWHALLPQLRELAHVTLVDLPGTGAAPAAAYELPALLDSVLACAPARAYYVGWSLGGSLALALARRAPERVQGVLALATNLSFVAREDWPSAMPAADFAGFVGQVEKRGERALSRFDLLQTAGGSRERQSQQWCRQLRGGSCDMPSLLSGLGLLQSLDHVGLALPVPTAFLFGECDALVPVAAADAIRTQLQPLALEVLADSNHLLPLSAAAAVLQMLAELGCELPPAATVQRDKIAVAKSFGAAASTYDGVAALQRGIGADLLQRGAARAGAGVEQILDLGCGTGYFRESLLELCPSARYAGLDLAEGMAHYAATCGSGAWLVGDAEDLPLAAASIDLVFSNLAIQWSENLTLLFTELARVLAPGGSALIATLGPRTLGELRESWSAVDGYEHVNQFATVAQLQAAVTAAGLNLEQLTLQDRVVPYQHARELLRELKQLGAHNVNAERPAGLTGRRRLQALFDAYEEHRRDGILPATYEVIYLEVSARHG